VAGRVQRGQHAQPVGRRCSAISCYRITEPVLRPIRVAADLGGIDISPVILILLIILIKDIIVRYIYPSVF
jgi:uncharacterized protein YggT (Ycf19 family)